MGTRGAVFWHSAAGLVFFLGFVFLPRVLPGLNGQRLFLWVCVGGAILSFVMTNVACATAARSGSSSA